MAQVKVFARRVLIVAGVLGGFTAASLGAFEAAGAAYSVGRYVGAR